MQLYKILTNKIFFYISSRYITYVAQFLTSLVLASKLGPYYFGSYAFITLIIGYLAALNFGITNAVTVLLVQSKFDKREITRIISNGMILVLFVAVLLLLTNLFISKLEINQFGKYGVSSYLWCITAIAVLGHFNILFLTVYRFKNQLLDVAFQQSFKPIIVFAAAIIASKNHVFNAVIISNLIGELIPFLLFFIKMPGVFLLKFSRNMCKKIIKKAFYLFLYLSSTAFILISSRTFVSYYYSVDNFGLFSFSFSMANAVLLFFQALMFLVTPKILDKLNNTADEVVLDLVEKLNNYFITFNYFIVFLIMLLFPFIIDFFPKWDKCLPSLNMSFLTVLMTSGSFISNSYLMSKNKEKELSVISIITLGSSIVMSFIFVAVLKVRMEYFLGAMVASYFIHGFLSAVTMYRELGTFNFASVFVRFMPVKISLPFFVSICCVLLNNYLGILLSFGLFVLFNFRDLMQLIVYTKRLVVNSSMFDLN